MADGTAELSIVPVAGIPEIASGDDLADRIVAAHPDLLDDDIVVITSKVVSKAEGRVVQGKDRSAAIAQESVRVVASSGDLQIAQTRHGLVLAAAGVDASNTEAGSVVLLPEDPDASARAIRSALQQRINRRVAVIISDTAGRPWRTGQTDMAIGAAGVHVTVPYAGTTDPFGNELSVTEPAVADEIASAANLVLGKCAQQPVAIVRGLGDLVTDDDGPGAAALVRPATDDLFRLGTGSVVSARRTIRRFSPEPVPHETLLAAISDAVTAPAPHHTAPWRFVIVDEPTTRSGLLDRMADQWTKDLRGDGFTESAITRRVRRGDILREAPTLVIPCLVGDGMHPYPDARRRDAERSMFMLSMGAGIENFLVSLAARDVGSAWIGSTLFCPDVVRQVLDLPDSWHPAGSVAVGLAHDPAPAREARDPANYLLER